MKRATDAAQCCIGPIRQNASQERASATNVIDTDTSDQSVDEKEVRQAARARWRLTMQAFDAGVEQDVQLLQVKTLVKSPAVYVTVNVEGKDATCLVNRFSSC